MIWSLKHLICAVCLLGLVCNTTNAQPFAKKPQESQITVSIPLDQLNDSAAKIAKQMLDRPTVQSKGPAETFRCSPEQYGWLLDNPDQAVVAWRRLGAKCVTIKKKAPGKFGYSDDTGTDISWDVIHQAKGVRIWYAEGKVKPAALLPLVPVKALVVMHYADGKLPEGEVIVQHHAEVIIHTDSKAAAAVTKMMGGSAPKLAEQGLAQLQMFFSVLSTFVERHPDRAESLFRPEKTTD